MRRQLCSLVLLLTTGVAQADIISWDCPASTFGRPFDSFGCWGFQQPVPGPDDTALFELESGLHVIEFDDVFVNDRVILSAGLLEFNLTGGAYTLTNPGFGTPSITIGPDAPGLVMMDIRGGPMQGVFVDLAPSIGNQVFFDVGAGATLLADVLHVGAGGNASFTCGAGGSVETPVASIADGSTATGFATVGGADATWACATRLTVGKAGFGVLDIENGGVVTGDEAIIGQQSSAFGAVTVRGATSRWELNGSLDLGFAGIGELAVEDGGLVTCGNYALLGTSGTQTGGVPSSGTLAVDGTGSAFDVDGPLWVGFGGGGTVVTSRGGRVFATGDLRHEALFDESTATFVIALGASDDYPVPDAAIQVGGFTSDLAFTVDLVDGFTPETGDAFALLSADLGLGVITLDLPALPGALVWDVDETANDIVISVRNAADIDNDGVVGVNDLVAVITAWGVCPGEPDACPADVNGDGEVDVDDLVLVIISWS